MNRHERRKQKKANASNLSTQNDLIKAINLHTNKNYEDANIMYKKIISKDPQNYEAIRHLGILNQDIGNYEEAYNLFFRSLEVRPNGFESLNNIGTIHTRNKNYQLALNCLRKSYQINPQYVPTINNLANLYYKLNRPSEALETSLKALEFQPDNPITKNQYAKALILNNSLEEAINLLQKCCDEYPENDDFAINLSTAYKEIGEFEKANTIIDEQFHKNYKNVSYMVGYIYNKKNKLNEKQLNFYKGQLNQNELHVDDKVLVHHAFFRNFQNQGDYEKAGEYLVKGNNLQYSIKPFSIEKEVKVFELIKSLFNKNKKLNTVKSDQPKPIFVCGMPRSGTTLCEQILSSHSKIDGAGELSYLAEMSGINQLISSDDMHLDKFEHVVKDEKSALQVRDDYLNALLSHSEKAVEFICDKMPHNFVLIGLIKLIFPEAKIIYCKRDPIDNCFSLYSQKFTELSHQYSYNQTILAKYYKLHKSMMDFWLNKFKKEIFVLDNEELVKDQEKISKQLIKFCNLDWEVQCLDFHKTKRQVRTASIEQVRQPINKKSIGAWKKYETHLEELVSALNE